MALAILRPAFFSRRIPLLRSSTSINSNPLYAKSQQQQRSISLSSYIVSPKELNDALKKNVRTKISTSPRVIPLCAAWFMPNDPEGRKGVDVYKQKRIPHARFFDIDVVKDPESPYPHMLPSKERFAQAMRTMGIRRDDEIVVYDTEEQGLLSAPRVGWTMRFFGHPNVHVLDNFRLWVREGYPVEEGEVSVDEPTDYQVDNFTPERVVHFQEIKEIAEDHGKEGADGVQIVDARPSPRWSGAGKEPRPGLPSGHMPGSVNVQLSDLVEPDTRTLLPAPELKRVFISKGIDPTRSVITTCGSGVTAAVVDIALEKAEFVPFENRRLYDGSWT